VRHDAVLARTGGPAGNARLTAWTGILLLPLFLAEVATLLSLHQFLSWHIVIGALLVPPALLKTVSVGWRVVRYYGGVTPYVDAGPPPLLLRVLGPAVVVSTLAVLGTGLTLVALGRDGTRTTLLSFAGQRVDALTLHQLSFVIWAGATGLHVLARGIAAVRVVSGAASSYQRVPGGGSRGTTVAATLLAGAVTAWLVLRAARAWTGG
jgi:hypothetical protein